MSIFKKFATLYLGVRRGFETTSTQFLGSRRHSVFSPKYYNYSNHLISNRFIFIKSLVLNFTGLHYISSAGIRVILKAVNAIRHLDGRIMLCCLQDYVKEVFETSGVGGLLPIFATNDDALNAF